MIVFVHKNLSKSFVLHGFEMLKINLLVELINPDFSLTCYKVSSKRCRFSFQLEMLNEDWLAYVMKQEVSRIDYFP